MTKDEHIKRLAGAMGLTVLPYGKSMLAQTNDRMPSEPIRVVGEVDPIGEIVGDHEVIYYDEADELPSDHMLDAMITAKARVSMSDYSLIEARTLAHYMDLDSIPLIGDEFYSLKYIKGPKVRGNAKAGHKAKAKAKRRAVNKAARKARRNNRG